VLVANRTQERADELAGALGGRSVSFDAIGDAITSCDVVIASTGSPDTIVQAGTVAKAAARREGHPLLIVDIAVPRDFDPAVRDLAGVSYIDLDDLQAVADKHSRMRQAEVEDVDALVEEETANFVQWVDHLQLVPTITALTDHAETVRTREVARTQLTRTIERLDLGDVERQQLTSQLDVLTKAIVKQLLHEPIATLRERGDRDIYVDTIRTLFHLDDADQG
jgi:glutamyl-tRNA reductase